MAKDARDTGTDDFIGLPGKRGRKPRGDAKTAAERQAAYRQRKTAQGIAPTALVAELQRKVSWLQKEKDLLERERNAAFSGNDALKRENERLLRKLEMATAGN